VLAHCGKEGCGGEDDATQEEEDTKWGDVLSEVAEGPVGTVVPMGVGEAGWWWLQARRQLRARWQPQTLWWLKHSEMAAGMVVAAAAAGSVMCTRWAWSVGGC